jgi:hypothetical protein
MKRSDYYLSASLALSLPLLSTGCFVTSTVRAHAALHYVPPGVILSYGEHRTGKANKLCAILGVKWTAQDNEDLKLAIQSALNTSPEAKAAQDTSIAAKQSLQKQSLQKQSLRKKEAPPVEERAAEGAIDTSQCDPRFLPHYCLKKVQQPQPSSLPTKVEESADQPYDSPYEMLVDASVTELTTWYPFGIAICEISVSGRATRILQPAPVTSLAPDAKTNP